MEEQKKVKMNVVKGEEQESKKLTYEQLHDIANRLVQDNQYLRQQLQQASDTIRMFNRLDYLFKVLQYEHTIKDAEFIGNCVSEIKDAMTITPSEEEKEEK